MKHAIDTKQDEEFLCQLCEETFFHRSDEVAVCPRCGATGEQWILHLSVLDDDDERRDSETTGSLVS